MMDDMKALPSEEQEAANAAYTWAKECHAALGLAVAENKPHQKESFANIEWAFRRYKRAVGLERAASSQCSPA